MKTRSPLFLLSVLFSGMTGLAHAGVTYQWFDSKGGIHFTDDYYATPVALRDTAQLIVRTDLAKEQTADSNTVGYAVTQGIVDRENNGENYRQSLGYVDTSSDSFEPPQNVTVIVVNNSALHAKQSPCRASRACAVRFKPDFGDRQYIHPSVFNGGSRPYVRPGLFRSGRK